MKTNHQLLAFALGTTLLFTACKHEPAPQPGGGNNNNNPPTSVDTLNPSFASSILPIFIANCSGCHNNTLANDGYNFTTYQNIIAKKFVPGNLDQTKLYYAITDDDERDRMPQAPNPRLSAGNIKLIKNWILNGAPNN